MRSITHFSYGFDYYNDADLIGQFPTPEWDSGTMSSNNDISGETGWRVGTPVSINASGQLEMTADGATPDYYLHQDVLTELDYQKWVNDIKLDVTLFGNAAAVMIGGRGKIIETGLLDEDVGTFSAGDDIFVANGKFTNVDPNTGDVIGEVIEIDGETRDGIVKDAVKIMLHQ